MIIPAVSATMFAASLLAQVAPETKAEGLAELYGRTLGSAAQCSVGRDRLDGAAQLASARLKSLAQDDAERTTAGMRLAAAIDQGGRDVANGLVTCAQAESDFTNLEHELAATR